MAPIGRARVRELCRAVAILAVILSAHCAPGDAEDRARAGSVTARAAVERLRALIGPGFESKTAVSHRARVQVAKRADVALVLEDEDSDVAIGVALRGALGVEAEFVQRDVVYPGVLGSGSDLVHRRTKAGAEDYLLFESCPVDPGIVYD